MTGGDPGMNAKGSPEARPQGVPQRRPLALGARAGTTSSTEGAEAESCRFRTGAVVLPVRQARTGTTGFRLRGRMPK